MAALFPAVFGTVKEVPFHAAYIGFSLIAAAAMWSLARRFSPHPEWAALLFLAVPVFVVNGNSFEPDVPFAALWIAAVAFFCAERWGLAAVAMAAASLFAYQAVFLTPILGLYLWVYGKRERAAWLSIFTPFAAVAVWQLWARSTGALPATVLTGYFSHYAFQAIANKLRNAVGLAIHSWFIVCPLLAPGAAVLAWRSRQDRDTRFLAGWIALFYLAAVVVFFAGSARYLLPMAAPVVLLASRLAPRWLAIGFVAQMAISFGTRGGELPALGWLSKAARRGPRASGCGVDGEWGLRYYLESRGALPLTHMQKLRSRRLRRVERAGACGGFDRPGDGRGGDGDHLGHSAADYRARFAFGILRCFRRVLAVRHDSTEPIRPRADVSHRRAAYYADLD